MRTSVICIWFDPWYFENELHLLQNFSQTLADALGRSIVTRREIIGRLLRDYISIFTSVSLPYGLTVSPEEIAKGMGETLSSVKLEERKRVIGNLLRHEKKRVVVFMDDIDRLDKKEIQAVFKLVKLCADFDYTTYVLAFDEKMVAEALGEKYGAGDKEGGQKFIEKIVQLPLRLSMADISSLRSICSGCIDEALKRADVQLTNEQVQLFVSYFTRGLEISVQTPRMAKRYGNALLFSLSILKDEVNSVDLMLLEGIRISYPCLYETIRKYPSVFLGVGLESMRNDERIKERNRRVINEGLKKLTEDKKEAALDLLKYLFPRVRTAYENTYYMSKSDHEWAENQRIASKEYLNRFFSYTISKDDVSDISIESFLGKTRILSVENIVTEIRELVKNKKTDYFVSRILRKVKKLSPDISANLALAIARLGDIFPDLELSGMYSYASTFSRAALLVSELVKNIPEKKERFDTAKLIVEDGEPIPFVIKYFEWLKKKKEEQNGVVSVEEEKLLSEIIVDRIREYSKVAPIYVQSPRYASDLLHFWSYWGSREETNEYIARTIDEDPHNAFKLLRSYLQPVEDVETGVFYKGGFGETEYGLVTVVVDASVIYDALYKIYGSDLDSPKFDEDEDEPSDEAITHQFAQVYHNVNAEKKKTTNKEDHL